MEQNKLHREYIVTVQPSCPRRQQMLMISTSYTRRKSAIFVTWEFDLRPYSINSWVARRCPGLYNSQSGQPPPLPEHPHNLYPLHDLSRVVLEPCKVSALYLQNFENALRQIETDRPRQSSLSLYRYR